MLFTSFTSDAPSESTSPKRGSRRGTRGSGKGHLAGDPTDHLDALTAAHEKGDHVQARRHAFAFVRALDAKHGLPAKPALNAVKGQAPPLSNALQPAAQSPSNPLRLFAALKASRKGV